MLHFEAFSHSNVNDDIGPATRSKLLSFGDQQKCGLKIEIAATVDYVKQFVKATYIFEGDGPVALECYEVIQKVSETLRTGHTRKCAIQQLTGAPPTDMRCQTLVAYPKHCAQPELEYF